MVANHYFVAQIIVPIFPTLAQVET